MKMHCRENIIDWYTFCCKQLAQINYVYELDLLLLNAANDIWCTFITLNSRKNELEHINQNTDIYEFVE